MFPCAITHLVSQRNEGNLVVGGSLFICFQICPQTKRAREWITKVCSEYFKSDFLCGGENPQAARCLLKNTAVPSVVPWPSHSVSKERTTNTSLKSASFSMYRRMIHHQDLHPVKVMKQLVGTLDTYYF